MLISPPDDPHRPAPTRTDPHRPPPTLANPRQPSLTGVLTISQPQPILKYETVRESIDWKPNIAFAVGCEDLLTFDLFFGAIPPHFDQQRFRAKFCEIVDATESHIEYPRYY